MANRLTTQVLDDGDKWTVIKIVGVLDTSNQARTRVVQVSALTPAPVEVSIDEIYFQVSQPVNVLLDWDASTPVDAITLSYSGEFCNMVQEWGGLTNNAGTGVTGDIYLTTFGWAAGTIPFTVILKLKKRKFA